MEQHSFVALRRFEGVLGQPKGPSLEIDVILDHLLHLTEFLGREGDRLAGEAVGNPLLHPVVHL